jgi:hypothetical protein
MRFLGPVVEQLDRALVELSADHAINHRHALILVDNAVELLIHRYAVEAAEAPPWRKARLSWQQKQWARGQSFDDKLKVMELLGAMSADERAFARICHTYRNQLYHVGLRHEAIMQALARAYFLLACELFMRLQPRGMSFGKRDRESAIGKRIFGEKGMGGFDAIRQIGPDLAGACPSDPDLKTTLTREADRILDEMVEWLDFLVEGQRPHVTTKQKELREAQMWHDFGEAIAAHHEAREKAGLPRDNPRPCDVMTLPWKPRHATLPEQRWRQQIRDIAKAATDAGALQRYEAFRAKTVYLHGALRRSVGALEEEIERQIDAAREWRRGA